MNIENNKPILWVIGSEGFIGANLQAFFASRCNILGVSLEKITFNDQVREFDRYSDLITYLVDGLKNGDIDKPNYIVYAAGSGSVPLSVENPLLDFSRNVDDYYQFLNVVGPHAGYAKLVHLSSAAVFGAKNTASKSSDPVNIDNIASPYGMHKYLAEQAGEFFSMRNDLDVINLRIFSVYGIGLKKQIGWDLYHKSIDNDGLITLRGSGQEQRDWISINDVCLMLERIFENEQVWKKPGAILNCGTGVASTVKDYAEIFCDYFDLDKPVFTQKESSGDPSILVSNIDYEKNILDWEPVTSLKDGLAEYFDWLSKNA